jgi:hypothetical protein
MLDDELKWLIDELCRLFKNCSSRMVVCLFISDETQEERFPEDILLLLELVFLELVENDCWTVVDCWKELCWRLGV